MPVVPRISDRDSNCYDATLRGVKCVSKSRRAASLSAKSLSRLRPVENPRRKHCAEVGRAGEWNVVALSKRTGSLLKRLYDRVGNLVLNGPFTGRYPDEMNSWAIQHDRENSTERYVIDICDRFSGGWKISYLHDTFSP